MISVQGTDTSTPEVGEIQAVQKFVLVHRYFSIPLAARLGIGHGYAVEIRDQQRVRSE